VQTRRWVNQSQPQTLVIATFLLYAGVVFIILGSGTGLGFAIANTIDGANSIENLARLFVAVGGAFAGYQIAQEKKIGYYLGIAVAGLPLAAKLIAVLRDRIDFVDLDLVNLLFEIALLALILHTQSRSYVRLWFK
jgi:hypothetical protein